VDGKVRTLKLGLGRAERDPKAILRLFRERLSAKPETLNAEFGFEAVRLDALEIAPFIFHATDLAPTSKRDLDAEARMADTISARLGAGHIGHILSRDAHTPERASYFALMSETGAQDPAPPADNVMRRPLFLFADAQPIEALASVPDGPPMQFRWRRVLHQVARAEGPERILPDWLRNPGARPCDYYRVEDQHGRRFWLYREGLFENPETPPRWFIQGLFA
jgi:protein ImuB